MSLKYLPVTLLLAQPVFTSGFTSTCDAIGVEGTVLSASCLTEGGSRLSSTLDLNTCIANANGTLVV